MTVAAVDLNADLGELTDGGALDAAMLEVVTSASIACGFHAGDPETMRRTLEAARLRGVSIGAHPSYADRADFGRAELDVDPSKVRDDVLYQIGALDALARGSGAELRYVKPHGALYNRMYGDEACATAVCEAVAVFGGMVLLAQAGSSALEVAKGLGLDTESEVFADRAYLADGRLAPRDTPGAVLSDPDEVARRALWLATEHRVPTIDDGWIELDGSSICIHGDTPGALATAKRVRSQLAAAGVTLSAFCS